jgi:hypothetical protein
MKFTKFTNAKLFSLLIVGALLIGSCNNGSNKETEEVPPVDSTQNILQNLGGEIFSIPSPIQSAMFIKKSGMTYNKALLNETSKTASYSTRFAMAMNLGVFGADLAYVTLYDQTQDAVSYLNSAKKLAAELGITGAFPNSTIERFSKNLGNKDTMLVLVGIAYRNCDAYLKNNDQNDISGLILAGGWLESLYFATTTHQSKPSEETKKRIAEQKSSLKSLVNLLNQFYSQPEYTEFIDNLRDLQSEYDAVEFTYVYEKPTSDAANKVTTINSKTEVKISKEKIDAITEKVKSIRNQIIG